MSNQFSEKYSLFTTVQLLKILLEKQNYQNEAIFAAEQELSKRFVSEEEKNEAQAELEKNKQDYIDKSKNNYISRIFDNIKLLQPTSKRTPEQVLNIFCVFSALCSILYFYSNFGYLRFLLSPSESISILDVLIFIPSLLQFVLIYGLYKRKLFAWKVQNILTTALFVSHIFKFLSLVLVPFWFTSKNIAIYIWDLTVYSLLFYFINSQNIVSQFDVDKILKVKLIITTTIIIGLCFVIYYAVLLFS